MFRAIMAFLVSLVFISRLSYSPTTKDTDIKRKDSIVPEIVYVEGGIFEMGCQYGETDEEPVHKVRLSNYYIGRYEVTNAEYCAFLNRRRPGARDLKTWIDIGNDNFDIQKKPLGDYFVVSGRERYPVTHVSWYGASAYCDWLRDYTGEPYRLPTEAEWEFAAKGGINGHYRVYSGSGDLREVAWFAYNSEGELHPVGLKKSNELTLYDMNGNVHEWVNDFYDAHYYEESEVDNPTGPEKGFECIIRGGCWTWEEEDVRNEARFKAAPYHTNLTIGFRIACDR